MYFRNVSDKIMKSEHIVNRAVGDYLYRKKSLGGNYNYINLAM
jgi:hypothetical protein